MHRRTCESTPSRGSVGVLQALMANVLLAGTTRGAEETGPEVLHAVMHAGGFDGQAGEEHGDRVPDGEAGGAGDPVASAVTHLQLGDATPGLRCIDDADF